MSEILKKETIASGKFLELQNITFKNDDGKIVNWEACQRKNDANAVSIVAILFPSYEFLFIKEFRAPVGKYCIGCSAGIIENKEDVKEAAIRELKEETGYTGKIVYVGCAGENSAGLTGELTTTVLAVINENDDCNKNVKQSLDENEHIELIRVPFEDFPTFVEEENKKGNVLSSKLINLLIGAKIMFTMMNNDEKKKD